MEIALFFFFWYRYVSIRLLLYSLTSSKGKNCELLSWNLWIKEASQKYF